MCCRQLWYDLGSIVLWVTGWLSRPEILCCCFIDLVVCIYHNSCQFLKMTSSKCLHTINSLFPHFSLILISCSNVWLEDVSVFQIIYQKFGKSLYKELWIFQSWGTTNRIIPQYYKYCETSYLPFGKLYHHPICNSSISELAVYPCRRKIDQYYSIWSGERLMMCNN